METVGSEHRFPFRMVLTPLYLLSLKTVCGVHCGSVRLRALREAHLRAVLQSFVAGLPGGAGILFLRRWGEIFENILFFFRFYF